MRPEASFPRNRQPPGRFSRLAREKAERSTARGRSGAPRDSPSDKLRPECQAVRTLLQPSPRVVALVWASIDPRFQGEVGGGQRPARRHAGHQVEPGVGYPILALSAELWV